MDVGVIGAGGNQGAIVLVESDVLGGELHDPVVTQNGGGAVFASGDLLEGEVVVAGCGWDDLAYECFFLGCGGWGGRL